MTERKIPMTEVDEISRTLGRLEADAASARNQREKIFELIGEVQLSLGAIPALIEKVDDHSVHIEDFKGLKNKGIGVLAFVAMLGGAVGVGIDRIVGIFK